MRVAIAGAGKVGRSIAAELTENGHDVMLIDRDPDTVRPDRIPGAQWLVADACELAVLEKADLASCQVVIAATGDDKVNLVVSLLAKTEFGVPRVVARVNHPQNEWMFNEAWGVDVAVSTPRMLSALVAILRDGRVLPPTPDDPIEAGDELLFVASASAEEALQEMLSPHHGHGPAPVGR
ncbi:MAG: potassium channel family protein [Actinomycetes bacterium]